MGITHINGSFIVIKSIEIPVRIDLTAYAREYGTEMTDYGNLEEAVAYVAGLIKEGAAERLAQVGGYASVVGAVPVS